MTENENQIKNMSNEKDIEAKSDGNFKKLDNNREQFLTTLTWENINVVLPQKKPGLFASQEVIDQYKLAGPKAILKNGRL
jgi:hypothetical protein